MKNAQVAPFIYPPDPIFKSIGERHVFDALKPVLGDGDALFANLELSDPQEGDIEIDFVLLLEDYGCIVIEVKGAHITFDDGSWIQSDPSGKHPIDPAGQAKRNMYALREYITSKWSQGVLRCEWLVAFPHSNIVDVHDPNLPKSKIIEKGGLPYAMGQIRNQLNSVRSSFPLPNYSGWVELAANTLIPLSAQKTDRESVLGNNYEFIRGLTHEKEVLLSQLADNDRYYVKGPAGSGKTWLAFEQARRWAKAGLKVGIVVYNTGLSTYMRNKNAEAPEGEQVAWVSDFHEFATSIGSAAGNPNHYADVVDRYAEDLIAKAGALDESQKFDAWVIDEAQDFMPSWWKTLELSLRDPAHGKMALFGDDQQQVFGHRPAPAGNFANFRLNENLRNSQQIAHAISQFVDRPTVALGPHAFEIEYVESAPEKIFETADDVVEMLTDKEFWHPGEIALLTTKSRHPEYVRQSESDRAGHWASLWENEDVFYCTVGGFKGLERAVVVLAVDGFHPDSDPDDVLYVGMSRARDKLVVVAERTMIVRLKELNSRGRK